MELLRWIRLLGWLLKTDDVLRGLRAVYRLANRLRDLRGRGRFHRRRLGWMGQLAGDAVIMAVDQWPGLWLRRGTKRVLERSDEYRLRDRRGAGGSDGSHRGDSGGRGGSGRHNRQCVFAPRR